MVEGGPIISARLGTGYSASGFAVGESGERG